MEQHDITAPGVRVHYVRITNHGDTTFTDRHDGVPIAIEPGRADNFPLDMATHFLGDFSNPEAMFRHVCRRQGWNTPAHLIAQPSGKTLAQEKFAQLEIRPVVYKMVEETVNTDEPIPAEEIPAILPKRGKAQ